MEKIVKTGSVDQYCLHAFNQILEVMPEGPEKKAITESVSAQRSAKHLDDLIFKFVCFMVLIVAGWITWNWILSPSPWLATRSIVGATLKDPNSAEYSNFAVIKEIDKGKMVRFGTYIEVRARNGFGGMVNSSYCVQFDAEKNSTKYYYSRELAVMECSPSTAEITINSMINRELRY